MGFIEKSGCKYLSIMKVVFCFFSPIVYLRRIVIASGIHPVFSAAVKQLIFVMSSTFLSFAKATSTLDFSKPMS